MGLFQKNPDTMTIQINGSTYDVPVAVAAHVSCLEVQYNTQKRRADSLKTERDHFLKLFKDVNSEATRLYIENREYKHREEQNDKQGVKKMTYRKYGGSTRSFVTFKDGHEEDIVFYQAQNNKVLFATGSGIYFCEEEPPLSLNTRTTYYRFQISDNPAIRYETESVDTIASITLSSKVRREYCIDLKVGPHIHGNLVVSRDISDEAFREMCIQDAIKNVTFKDA